MFRSSGKGVAGLVFVIVCVLVPAAQAGEVRDPTRPPQAAAPTNQTAAPARRDYVLQSTRISGDLRSAVINGQVVAVGDRVDGARVLSVEPGEARLRDELGAFTLRLDLPRITRPARHSSALREANP